MQKAGRSQWLGGINVRLMAAKGGVIERQRGAGGVRLAQGHRVFRVTVLYVTQVENDSRAQYGV